MEESPKGRFLEKLIRIKNHKKARKINGWSATVSRGDRKVFGVENARKELL